MMKTATHISAGLLQPLSMPPEQIFHVGMHLLGPFPTSALGNKRVVVATDHAMWCAIPTSCATVLVDCAPFSQIEATIFCQRCQRDSSILVYTAQAHYSPNLMVAND